MPLIIPSNSQSASGYTIDQSIRFNPTDNPYMHKTYSSAGDRTSWTWSCWFKLGTLNNFAAGSGLYYQFFACDNAKNDSNRGSFHIIADTSVASAIAFQFQGHSTSFIRTNRQFRDPSAWMHLVLVWDSDNAIPSDRARLYINGARETDFAGSSNPSSGQEIGINLGEIHRLGISYNISGAAVNYPFDGYMADIHFLDGYSYGPEFFGETNDSGIWIPKEYSGSYGSNGFKIDGRDSSDLGDDESGNGNDYTTSGLASHDQVADSPTNNFAVANPLHATTYMGSYAFSEGNLQFTFGSSVGGLATIAVSSGKWYVEWEVHGSASPPFYLFGIYGDEPSATTRYVGYEANSYGYYAYNGTYWNNNVGTSYGDTFGAGDIIGMALDLDNNKLYFSKNGTFQNSGDPTSGSTGTGAISISSASSVPLGQYFIASSSGSSVPSNHSANYNFGQDGTFAGNVTAGGNSDSNGVGNFKYSVPSGYLALCTKNLGS